MPQRVVVIYSCSLCKAEFDQPEKITPYKLSGGGKVLDFDFCSGCTVGHEGLQALFALGIQDRGTVAATDDKPARIRCEICDEVFTRSGMPLHKSRTHNIKPPPKNNSKAPGNGPHKCPDCNFGAHAATGLMAHRRSVHRIKK